MTEIVGSPERGPADWQLPLDDYAVDAAAGMLTVQLSVDIATAYSRLEVYALAVERPVTDVAEDWIAGLRPPTRSALRST